MLLFINFAIIISQVLKGSISNLFFKLFTMKFLVLAVSAVAAVSAVDITLRGLDQDPEVVQGVIDTLWEIYAKLQELGKN